MTETRFTPGPWLAVSDPCHFDTISDVIGGVTRKKPAPINQIHVSVGGFADLHEQEANTRLIAAAPELYDALSEPERRLRQCASNIEDEYPYWARDLLKMADEMASVLAKARGEHEGEKA